MKIGRLLVRLVSGLFIGHGTQKLFGWFDGPGPDGTEQMMYKLDMHPARHNALAVGATETAGGALLALGLAAPLAAASLVGVILTAIRKVHAANGPWNTKGGYEYNLVLIAALAGLVDGGPGDVHRPGARHPRHRPSLGAGRARPGRRGLGPHRRTQPRTGQGREHEPDAEAVDEEASAEAVRAGR